MRPSLHFAKMMFGRQLVIGAEIGVERAENALVILTEWGEVLKLFLIEKEISFEQRIRERLEGAEDRYSLILKPSIEASRDFQNSSLDFVYIDANHSSESCYQDIIAWYPKLKSGGIICGHDFGKDMADDSVKQAVVQFFNENNIELNIEDTDWWGVKRV